MFMHTDTHAHVLVHTHTHAQIHVGVHVHMYTHAHTGMNAHIHTPVYTCTDTCVHTHAQVLTHAHTCMNTRGNMYTHIYACLSVHICAYMHVHMQCTHTHAVQAPERRGQPPHLSSPGSLLRPPPVTESPTQPLSLRRPVEGRERTTSTSAGPWDLSSPLQTRTATSRLEAVRTKGAALS